MRTSVPELQRYVVFYNEHGPIELPHCNPLTGVITEEISVSCDKCGVLVPSELVHGVANSYRLHTEFRFVAACNECALVIHNVIRFTSTGELMFQNRGEWFITVTPWWRKFLRSLRLS